MSKIKASVIIPTLNKLSRLRLVLKSLEKQVTDEVEVIIVFDGCDEEVINGFRELQFTFNPIEVICKTNVGRACARNKGIERARGEIIIFLDDDRITEGNYIANHLAYHEKGHVAVLGRRQEIFLTDREIAYYYHTLPECMEKCYSQSERDHGYSFVPFIDTVAPWCSFFTGNVSIRREDLLQVGCFDEAFKEWGHEDIELGIRIAYNKVKIIKCDDAINYHMMHSSNFIDKRKASLNNMRYLLKKHKRKLIVQLVLRGIMFKQWLVGIYIPKNQKNKYELRGEE